MTTSRIALCLLVLSLSTAASAAGSDFYIGGGFGPSSVDPGCNSCDTDDTGYKIYGGMALHHTPYLDLAVELGYIDFGHSTAGGLLGSESKVDASALTGAAALRYHFTPRFGVVGRLGLGYVKGKESLSTPIGGNSNSDSSLQPYLGFGVEYALNKQFSVTGAFDYTQFDTGESDGDAYLLSVGLQYGF